MPPQVYRRLVNTVDRKPEQPHEETIGLNIMIRAGSITLPAGMKELMNVFYEVMEKRFEWNPRSTGNNAAVGAAVLDGERKFGECGCLANALLCLLRCPRPYGFGVGSGVGATVETYPGAHKLGFITRHEREFYRLGPNVINPYNDSEKKYYLWENHKVLHYCGHYWDVCYNRSYQDSAGMAQGEIVKEEAARGYPLFKVETGQRTKYYIYNDRMQEKQATFIGPYDEDPGPPPKTNVNPPQVRKFGNCCVIM
jgi:hypothetical protein